MKEFRVCFTLENDVLWGTMSGDLSWNEADILRKLLKRVQERKYIFIKNEYQIYMVDTNKIRYIRIYSPVEDNIISFQ